VGKAIKEGCIVEDWSCCSWFVVVLSCWFCVKGCRVSVSWGGVGEAIDKLCGRGLAWENAVRSDGGRLLVDKPDIPDSKRPDVAIDRDRVSILSGVPGINVAVGALRWLVEGEALSEALEG
jgi:hypothetical protein